MILKLILGVLILLGPGESVQVFQTENYDYCDPSFHLCDVASEHIMCKYPKSGLSSRCSPQVHEPLSVAEKKRVLFWHNKFRNMVAKGVERNIIKNLPTASNMRQMYWDEELERLAVRWAEQCVSTTAAEASDKCRNTRRFRVSQNVGTKRTNGTFIDKQALQIVASWYKDGKDFNASTVDFFLPTGNDGPMKRFANMIWAEKYAIGCARVIFYEPSTDDVGASMWMVERLVCNYGPGENEAGKAVYKRGVACENCPAGTRCGRAFPGLCALQSTDKSEGLPELTGYVGTTEIFSTTPEGSDLGLEESALEENSENRIYTSAEEEETSTEESMTPFTLQTKYTLMADPRLRKGEVVKAEPYPKGGKYSIKTGVYLDGKCHCYDVYRSGSRSDRTFVLAGTLLMPTLVLFRRPPTHSIVSYF